MTDLQCAARVFVARHGEADYESALLGDFGGSLSSRGRDQSRALAQSLTGERIARVWCSPMARAVQTAEIAAGVLGVDVVVREGLREFSVGDHAELIGRVQDVLSEVADAHRGESVLVISHGGAICAAVPWVATNLSSGRTRVLPLGNCDVVALEADADGWVARSWAGSPVT